MKLKLHWQIFIAMGAAYLFQRSLGGASAFVEPLGFLFIQALKMVVLPLVFFSVVLGVAGVGPGARLGKLAGKTVGYYLTTSFLAIVTGLILVNLIQPGAEARLAHGMAFDPATLERPDSAFDLLARMVPPNPVAAAVDGDMLGFIVFCVFFGVGLASLPTAKSGRILPLFQAGSDAVMKITHGIILTAPLGVFGLIVAMLNQDMGAAWHRAVGWYMFTIAVGLTFHFLVMLPALYVLLARRNPWQLYKGMAPALATVFATSSSMATLPVTMECVERNMGVPNRVAGFVLPLGATVNMDGTALFECVGVLFIAQVLGAPLGWEQQMVVMLTALLASVGAAAVPSSGLVMIFIVLEAVGLQGKEVPLIVGTMLAVDRPLDMMRGLVNIFSDAVGAVAIARSEGVLNRRGNQRRAAAPGAGA
ncbi:MAG: dicarboxylate/amino acid:cation symporter [Nitrospinaceae bacterium]